MAMGAPTATTMGPVPMHTDIHLMTLMQWLSPGFPISSFAYSHGLEAAIADGHISDAESLHDWLEGLLIYGTGQSDAIWIRLAFAAKDEAALMALNEQARAFLPAQARRIEAAKQGAAFARTVNSVWDCALPDLLLPLALGAAAQRQSMDIELVIPLYLQSFVANLIAASQRMMPLGQTEGQRLLSRLHPSSLYVARASAGQTMADISSTTFLSDIVAMRHETLQPRIFHS